MAEFKTSEVKNFNDGVWGRWENTCAFNYLMDRKIKENLLHILKCYQYLVEIPFGFFFLLNWQLSILAFLGMPFLGFTDMSILLNVQDMLWQMFRNNLHTFSTNYLYRRLYIFPFFFPHLILLSKSAFQLPDPDLKKKIILNL